MGSQDNIKRMDELLIQFKRLEAEIASLKREYQVGYVLIDGKNIRSDKVIWTRTGKPLVDTTWNRIIKFLRAIFMNASYTI